MSPKGVEAAVAEWYRYRTVACFVTGSSPVPLKTRCVGQRCTLNLSRAETSSRWWGVVVRRGRDASLCGGDGTNGQIKICYQDQDTFNGLIGRLHQRVQIQFQQ
ncbi:uncharacterized protein TNCV_192801 [Trichonephila clavipes]|nr:uncharacterized protein TNCV_192801 [Trichonephila clavipes]